MIISFKTEVFKKFIDKICYCKYIYKIYDWREYIDLFYIFNPVQ